MFSFSSWLRKLVPAPARTSRRAPRRPATALRLEPLEDRLVPALTWNAIGPAPINNGQTAGGLAVSGRVTGIATDVNDANTIFIATAGGGVWKTTDGGAHWASQTDNLTDGNGKPIPLFMGAIAESHGSGGNEVIYAGTGEANNSADSFYGSGILVSTDGGANWTLENNGGAFTGRTVSKIAIDPTNADIVYAALADFGTNRNHATASNTGIWKSVNGGMTWTNMTAAAPNNLSSKDEWSDVVIDPNTPTTLYAAEGTFFNTGGFATGNGVYKSIDAGVTWTLLNGAGTFNGTQDGRIALALYDDGTTDELFVSIAKPNSGGNGLYKMLESTNGGTSFTDLTSNVLAVSDYLHGQGDYDTTLIIDPNNSNYIYAAGAATKQGPSPNPFSGSPIESFDGGATWTDIATDPAKNGPHSDSHAVAFDKNGDLLDGDDGGVFKLSKPTDQTNQRWSSLNTTLQITQFTGIAIDTTTPNVVYGGSQDNATEKYTGSVAWDRIELGDGGLTAVDPTNHNVVYQSRFSSPNFNGHPLVQIQVSTNGGASFTSIGNNLNTPNHIAVHAVNFYVPYVLDGNGNVYLGTDFVNFSTNQGSTWSQIGTPGTSGFNTGGKAIDYLAVAPSNNNVVYVSVGGKMFVTQNAQAGGNNVTWTEVDLPGGAAARSLNSIAVDPNSPGTAYAVINTFTGGGKHVFKTTNFGGAWTDISANLLDTPVWSVTLASSGPATIVYVGTDVGAYATDNDGAAWVKLGTGLPNTQVVQLQYVPGQNILAVGTHGRGAYELTESADLSVTKTGPATVPSDNFLTYTFTVHNGGTTDAQSVTLSDLLPPQETFVSQKQTSGPAFTLSNNGNQITDTIATLSAGATATITVTVLVKSHTSLGTVLVNTAQDFSVTPDPTPGNNSSTTKTTVVTNLAVKQSISFSGAYVVKTLTMTNIGATTVTGAEFVDVLPAGTVAAFEYIPGVGFIPVSTAGGVAVVPVGTLAGGKSATVYLFVLVDIRVGGKYLTDTVSVRDFQEGTENLAEETLFVLNRARPH